MALDSARLQPARVRKGLLKNVGKSSLISNEPDYTQWLANIEIETDATEAVKVDGLWVRGPEGRGKTGAMLAALDDVESLIDKQENEAPVLFAYFLCDAGTDYCTAEDCIKSIIWQLIEKEKALATHANHAFASVRSLRPRLSRSSGLRKACQAAFRAPARSPACR